MKKTLALLMAAMMLLMALAIPAMAETDMEYVKNKGVLVVGITDFAPMDYKNEAGEWIGFDADLAKLFAEYLGVKIELVEIDWDNKILELNGKSIDCVWNGMTLTDEVMSAMETSNAGDYADVASLAALNFAVEAGSAGEAEIAALGYNMTAVQNQASALMEVKAGTSDAAVIDALMAAAMVGEGTSYADLTYTLSLNSEEYGALNEFMAAAYADGSMMAIAETYGVQAAIIPQ